MDQCCTHISEYSNYINKWFVTDLSQFCHRGFLRMFLQGFNRMRFELFLFEIELNSRPHHSSLSSKISSLVATSVSQKTHKVILGKNRLIGWKQNSRLCKRLFYKGIWWQHRDSNLGPHRRCTEVEAIQHRGVNEISRGNFTCTSGVRCPSFYPIQLRR